MDIVTLAAARKSGGSGGGVTRQYVDDHLALKADKTETEEYPISSSASGTSFVLTDAADGHVQNIKIKGATDSTTAQSVGDAGWGCIKLGDYNWSYISGVFYFTKGTLGAVGAGDIGYSNKYQIVRDVSSDNMPDKSILLGNSGFSGTYSVVVKDSRYGSDTTAFKNANADTVVYYKPSTAIYNTPMIGITTRDGEAIHGTSATLTTGLPLCSVGDVKDELDAKLGVVVKRCEKTTEQGQEVIVPLATPVEIPLTASELAQLRNLRTYNPTTSITITDDPTVDIGYLLDTDNGRAAENIQQQFINTVPLSMIAPEFSTSETYAVGDFVIYNFMLYKCTTAVQTAGAWNAANWTASTVADMLSA